MARRINTRFLLILSGIVVGVVLAAVIAFYVLIRPHPEQYESAAQDAESHHDWQAAVDNWGKAIGADPQNPWLYVQLGNALHRQGLGNMTFAAAQKDVAAWQQALEINPDYPQAVHALWQYWDQIRNDDPNNVNALQQTSKYAKQLVPLEPDAPDIEQVQASLYTTTIEGWLHGVATDPSEIDNAQSSMVALITKDPSNPDLRFYLAQTEAHRAQELARESGEQSQSSDSTAMFRKSVADMQAGVTAEPRDPTMHYHLSQLYTELGEMDRSSGADRPKYSTLAGQEMDKSVSLLKGNEPTFVEISVMGAERAIGEKDDAKAERIARNLLEQRPSDIDVVFRALTVIQSLPDLRQRAIDTLEAALNSGTQTTSVDVERFRVLLALTQLQIPDLIDSTSEAAQQRLLAEIQAHIKQMSDSNLDPMDVYRQEAALAFAQKQYIEVIRTLNLAMASLQNPSQMDPNLLWQLAEAYSLVNEREQALEYCQLTVQGAPAFLPAREKLVQLLMGQHTDEARQQIEENMNFLLRAAPNDPQVVTLEIEQLDASRDGDQIRQLYAQLPEASAEQCQAKSLVAMLSLKDSKDAIRLLKHALALAPDNLLSSALLARIYATDNQRTEAILTVEEAMKTHPSNIELQVLLKELQNTPMEQVQKFREQLYEANADPEQRDVDEAKKALQAGDAHTAEASLEAAEKLDPNDPTVWEQFYLLYKATKQWDKLQPYLDKLSAANRDQAHGALYQFEVAKAQNDTQRMMTIGLQLVNDLPEFAKSYYYLGMAYEAAGQYDQAIANYEAALQKKGSYGDAAEMLQSEIGCYYKMNQPDKALLALQEGRRRFPDNTWFEVEQTRHELDHGDPQSAVADLQTLLANNPNIPDLYLEMSQGEMEIAQAAQKNADTDTANTAMKAGSDALKQGMEKFPTDGRFYESLSDVDRIMGNVDEAEQLLLTMDNLPAFRNKPDPQILLARLYSLSNRPAKAEDAMHQAFLRSGQNVQLEDLLAEQLLQDHKFQDATNLLSTYNPDDPTVRREMVNVMVRSGQLAQATQALETLIAAHPADQASLQSTLAELYLSLNKTDQAMQLVNAMIQANPNNASALWVRGRVRMSMHPPDSDGALADFVAAAHLAPTDVNILSSLAELYAYRFDYDNEIQYLGEALRADPYNIGLRCSLAEAYATRQPPQYDQAMQTVNDGLNLQGAANDPNLALTAADIDQKMGKWDAAVNAIRTSLNEYPHDLTLLKQYMDLLLSGQKYDGVVQNANGILAEKKDLWWAWCDRGQAEAAQGQTANADRDLTQALALTDAQKDDADGVTVVKTMASALGNQRAISVLSSRRGSNPKWDMLLVLLYHQNNQDPQAIEVMEPLISPSLDISPAERLSRLQTAALIYCTVNPVAADKAFAAYQQILSINPDNLMALNNMACLCADDFKPPKLAEGLAAIRHAMDVLAKAHTNDPSVEDTYGWLMVLSGQTSEGMDMLHRAADQAQFPEVYYHLAEGYLRMNRPEDAEREVTAALTAISRAQQANQPVSPTLRQKVDELSNRVLDTMKLGTSGGMP